MCIYTYIYMYTYICIYIYIRARVAAARDHAHLFVTFDPGDNIRANGTSQRWTPLRMLPESGSIPRKLT